jgi:O-acetyl-ADP-ribose deacetylase (regulator of RNase III)
MSEEETHDEEETSQREQDEEEVAPVVTGEELDLPEDDGAEADHRLVVTRGDITMLPLREGALVNPSNTGLILNSGVGAAIMRRGGPFIQQKLHTLRSTLRRNRLDPGRVLETDPGQLPFQYLLHVSIAGARRINQRLIQRSLFNLFDKIEELELPEVSIPPLGYGTGKITLEEFLETFWEILVDELPRSEHLEQVYLCLETEEEFERAVQFFQENVEMTPEFMQVVIDEQGIGLGI